VPIDINHKYREPIVREGESGLLLLNIHYQQCQ
jgi:hypothetical protein